MDSRQITYAALSRKVEDHPGYLYRKSRRAHGRSLSIYGGNFKDLSSFIDMIESPDEYFRGGWHDEKQDELLTNLHRYFHNYVATAESLVTHTRNYIKHRHDDDQIGTNFREKVNTQFADHAATAVIKDFRNYFLHKGLPQSSINVSLDTNGAPPTIKILFSTEEVLKWKKWSSKSKKYLSTEGSDIWLRKLVAQYHNNVYEFYIWFDEMLEAHHRREVLEMESLISKLNELEDDPR